MRCCGGWLPSWASGDLITHMPFNLALQASCAFHKTIPQEVYGKLEEPDGLQGLVRLRQGGPRPEDQRLAAEKAGNWSEALTLYEQALQHNGGAVASGGGSGGCEGLQAAAGMLAGGAAGPAGLGPGLGSMQRGYLDCLLHIGHLQGLLAQVRLATCFGMHAECVLARSS